MKFISAQNAPSLGRECRGAITGADKSQLESIGQRLFSFLNSRSVQYAVLGIPDSYLTDGTDVDICADHPLELVKSLFDFCASEGLLFLNYYFHATGIRCDLAVPASDGKFLHFPGPDVLIFPTWRIKGYIGLSYRDLLRTRRWNPAGYYTPSDHDAFLFYLVKRIDKGSLNERHGQYLSSLWRRSEDSIDAIVRATWAPNHSSLVVEAARRQCWKGVANHLQDLRSALEAKSRVNPRRVRWILQRTYHRLRNTVGIHIAFLGCDGSGKSSVINSLVPLLSPAFRQTSQFHFRIAFASGQKSAAVHNPQDKPPRGRIASSAKLIFYLFGYVGGYLSKILPARVRNGLVIFDRYYDDLLVDPLRYRYGGPMWLARWIAALVPRPDLWIFLDVPTDVLVGRKQELPQHELARQREEYLRLLQDYKNSIIIDASRPLNEVVAEAVSAAANFLADRTRRRLG